MWHIVTKLKATLEYSDEVAEVSWRRQIKEERNHITRKNGHLLFLFENSFFMGSKTAMFITHFKEQAFGLLFFPPHVVYLL